MITPGPHSPVRPVIRAFYATLQELGAQAAATRYAATLRAQLEQAGQRVTPGVAPLDLVVDDQVGVVLMPLAGLITALTRRRIRRALRAAESPAVAVLLAFQPYPRLARVDVWRTALPETGKASVP